MCQIDEPYDVSDPDLITKPEIEGRKQTSARIGIRESRRVVGEYVLKHEDLLNETIFDDAIVILSSTVDVHTPSAVIYMPKKN